MGKSTVVRAVMGQARVLAGSVRLAQQFQVSVSTSIFASTNILFMMSPTTHEARMRHSYESCHICEIQIM